MLSVTLLASDEALTLARPEVEAIAAQQCLQVSPALGALTNERIHQTFQRKTDITWYAGHMGPAGIPLADGSLLPPTVLGAYVAAFEARLCVLNSCQGAECAAAVRSQAQRCTVLYWDEAVESATAYHVGSLLAQQLCAGGLEGALLFAREAGFRVLHAGMSYQFPGGGPSPDMLNVLYELRERLVRLEEKMVRLEEDVKQLRQHQPEEGLTAKQLIGVSVGAFVALMTLATLIYVLSGKWGG